MELFLLLIMITTNTIGSYGQTVAPDKTVEERVDDLEGRLATLNLEYARYQGQVAANDQDIIYINDYLDLLEEGQEELSGKDSSISTSISRISSNLTILTGEVGTLASRLTANNPPKISESIVDQIADLYTKINGTQTGTTNPTNGNTPTGISSDVALEIKRVDDNIFSVEEQLNITQEKIGDLESSFRLDSSKRDTFQEGLVSLVFGLQNKTEVLIDVVESLDWAKGERPIVNDTDGVYLLEHEVKALGKEMARETISLLGIMESIATLGSSVNAALLQGQTNGLAFDFINQGFHNLTEMLLFNFTALEDKINEAERRGPDGYDGVKSFVSDWSHLKSGEIKDVVDNKLLVLLAMIPVAFILSLYSSVVITLVIIVRLCRCCCQKKGDGRKEPNMNSPAFGTVHGPVTIASHKR